MTPVAVAVAERMVRLIAGRCSRCKEEWEDLNPVSYPASIFQLGLCHDKCHGQLLFVLGPTIDAEPSHDD